MVTNSSSRSRSTLSTTYPTLRFVRSQYRRRFHTLFVDDDDLTQILSRFEENSSSGFEFTDEFVAANVDTFDSKVASFISHKAMLQFSQAYLSIFISYAERALHASLLIKMRILTLLINCSFCSIGVHCLCQLKFLDYLQWEAIIRWILEYCFTNFHTKCVEFMPFNLFFATFIVSFSFTRHGVFKVNLFLYVSMSLRKKNHFSRYIETLRRSHGIV
ncbi:hypothetical protein DVH24_000298 [Malus domestica]|uniref:Uncharacterized protein n=1 Tax=Malus domestica TaxID=3750 RepID=A0A498IZ54_MALDO|nr:hypothetical protein DVH24_000298 [Malus domestica]